MLCPKCGKEIHESASMCEFCGSSLQPVSPVSAGLTQEKPENFVAGLVGAFLGSLLGAGCIILLDQVGYVASLSGVILSICTLKGYEMLGGKLSKKGVIACLVLMVLMPYLANQLSTAISFMNYAKSSGDFVSLGEAFAAVPALISANGYDTELYNYTLDSTPYYSGLAMVYLFTVLGGFSTAWSALKGSRQKKA